MGKVHGSLTRAGKVRNQTKHVAKKDKIRKKVGRVSFRIKIKKVNSKEYKKILTKFII